MTPEQKAEGRAKRIATNLKRYGVEWPLQLKSVQEKKKKAMLAKYGAENYLQSKKGKEHFKEVCFEKYGVDSHFKTKEVQDKIKATNIERYGVDHVWKSEEIYKKGENTRLEKYGDQSMTKTDYFKEKRSETLIKRFGTDNVSSVKEVQDKKKETWLSIYGVDHPWKSEEIREKSKQTMFEHYGVKHSMQSKEVTDKFKETCIEKYGVDNPWKSDEIREKIKQTCLEKFGVENPTQSKKIHDKINEAKRLLAYENFNRFKDTKPLFTVDEYKGSHRVYKWLKVSTGEEFFAPYYGSEPGKRFYFSSPEQFIINFLKKNNIEYETGKRNIIPPFELDFYMPKLNLAIETNGMYYHSTSILDEDTYHFNKFNLCKEKGIRLIQIFEDEILLKPQVIINRLRYIFKLCKYNIYARKCNITTIDSELKDKFLNKYHIQGSCVSKLNLGAFYKDRLVAVMTFSQNRKIISQAAGTWELTRFVTVGNFSITGIASKLYKHFLQKYNQTNSLVFTFSDLCWGEGSLYSQLGFNFTKYTSPGYFYYKNKQRYHRFTFRKSVLSKKVENFDSLKTEEENMIDNGYLKIYNAGNAKYIHSF